MSFVLSSQSPNVPAFDYQADAEVSFTQGKVGYNSAHEIKEDAGGNEATTLTIECIIADTATSAATYPVVKGIPIIHGMGQLWEADCTNVTAANQVNKTHDLTSATHIANTSTAQTDTGGVFHMVKIVGAVGGTKCLGYFIKLGQVVS